MSVQQCEANGRGNFRNQRCVISACDHSTHDFKLWSGLCCKNTESWKIIHWLYRFKFYTLSEAWSNTSPNASARTDVNIQTHRQPDKGKAFMSVCTAGFSESQYLRCICNTNYLEAVQTYVPILKKWPAKLAGISYRAWIPRPGVTVSDFQEFAKYAYSIGELFVCCT